MSKVYFGAGVVTGTTALALSPYTVRRVEGDSMRPTFNPDENTSRGRYNTFKGYISHWHWAKLIALHSSSRFFSDVVIIRKGVKSPRIGDVVCANNPRLDGGVLIKVRSHL